MLHPLTELLPLTDLLHRIISRQLTNTENILWAGRPILDKHLPMDPSYTRHRLGKKDSLYTMYSSMSSIVLIVSAIYADLFQSSSSKVSRRRSVKKAELILWIHAIVSVIPSQTIS